MTNHTTHLGEYQDHLRAFTKDLGETFDSGRITTFSPTYRIRELSVATGHNMQKPHQFVELLRAMADEVERIAEHEKRSDGRTPFFVDSITADVLDGVITVYFHDNE